MERIIQYDKWNNSSVTSKAKRILEDFENQVSSIFEKKYCPSNPDRIDNIEVELHEMKQNKLLLLFGIRNYDRSHREYEIRRVQWLIDQVMKEPLEERKNILWEVIEFDNRVASWNTSLNYSNVLSRYKESSIRNKNSNKMKAQLIESLL